QGGLPRLLRAWHGRQGHHPAVQPGARRRAEAGRHFPAVTGSAAGRTPGIATGPSITPALNIPSGIKRFAQTAALAVLRAPPIPQTSLTVAPTNRGRRRVVGKRPTARVSRCAWRRRVLRTRPP